MTKIYIMAIMEASASKIKMSGQCMHDS